MKKNYIVPIIRLGEIEYESLIATSQAGTDEAQAAYFKYDEEVQIDVATYFDGGWQ